VTHVAVSPRGGQAGLRRRRAHAPQRMASRQADVAREIGGLVEAALAAPRWMERNRNRAAGAVEHVGAARLHQCRERPRERSAAFVLEGVNHGAQRAVVRADRAGTIDGAIRAPAARTPRQRQADRAPRRQRIAAAIAQRRREREDRSPAAIADRSVCGMVERVAARRARRREHDAEDGVRDGLQTRN